MTETAQAVYVYGIVAANDVGDFDCVVHGSIAAVVGKASTDRPIAAADLREHDRIIADFVERGVAILPMRFGSAVADRHTVDTEILAPNAEAFEEGLRKLAGVVQFTLRVRYDRTAVLRLVVADDPDIAVARRQATSGSQAAKIRLGELVVNAIAQRRPDDAEQVRWSVREEAEAVQCTLSDNPDAVADIACLVRSDQIDTFLVAAERIAEKHSDLMRVKLLGPLAPYDFVPAI